MIIKSMSRKEPTFRQLLDYINRDQAAIAEHSISHNLLSHSDDEIAAEFEDNASHLKARANGNALYHEVISLPFHDELDFDAQAKILIDLAGNYLSQRAPDQLGYGRVHRDKKHIHLHLVISANALHSPTRAWLTKAQLAQIQRDIERYKLKRYPELGLREIYAASKTEQRRRDREHQAEQRTGLPSTRKAVAAQLDLIFAKARSLSELATMIQDAGFALYKRGQSQSIEHIETGTKYRLKTLGLETAFDDALKRFDLIEQRAVELIQIRRDQERQNRINERDNDDDHSSREPGD